MSIPRDHHYLPKFYTSRWTTDGKLFRYVRPTPNNTVHMKAVGTGAIGYKTDLYAYSEAPSERERQRLELDFFQAIDDRAAVALAKLDRGEHGAVIDKVGLVQFAISLLHRSPSRIDHLRGELARRMDPASCFDPVDPDHQAMIRDNINDLLADLVSSRKVVHLIANMAVYRIEVVSQHRLLTSDMPLMISPAIAEPLGFIMFPYAPTKLVIFAHNERVAAAFSSQKPEDLATAVNDAIVRQARDVVIASDANSRRFIENRFGREPRPALSDGLLRWNVP